MKIGNLRISDYWKARIQHFHQSIEILSNRENIQLQNI